MPEKTEAQKKAQKNYMQKFARLEIRVSPDDRAAIQAHASAWGESVNGFILRAVRETMARENKEPGG